MAGTEDTKICWLTTPQVVPGGSLPPVPEMDVPFVETLALQLVRTGREVSFTNPSG